ncbi:methylenetetrahydrofolate dehydrogenase/methylenetetrahydrofolate cyclohydrolase [Williamsoniiplasma somnilux]|uniref:Bifunctional protein FolD n=1 Tax=Williamsoniiplasma somnilux TaxID=215578 RepID=A0A2K8NYT8_9MOLU|nr:bifunctional 5,10-methylenetetrahydrofolate dehydrogenase/5,10-methenyltetrahydrofolate cyclohydrolase [Williamsoniiplasma somnilux]ATZ18990.1 methylenetetrahydrofolate dehydrogenase/methylenetetrahydrofolate cyclohydrolase [Williamsoniiplasma somnilux]
MIILDGKKVALQKRKELKLQIEEQIKHRHRKPKLVVILVGDNPSSLVYVEHKMKTAQKVGIESKTLHFPENIAHDELYKQINYLNKDDNVDGILLQLPLPARFVEEEYLQAIVPEKDVDGFHYKNQGRMLQNYNATYPCTPLGVINLLKAYEINLKGKNAVVVGTSNIVGKPLGIMLLNAGATVTFCNQDTQDIKLHTSQADLLISATGQKFIITKDMVKSNAIVVDIGIIRDLENNKLVGDVDYQNVAPMTSYITPVPGGVGPMTVISLMENTFKLYLEHQK